jgi:hypothetical protein
MEDGYNIIVNNKDKNRLFDREIQEQRLLEAARETSAEDAQALLLMGSFTKKVLRNKKPRPHELIRP